MENEQWENIDGYDYYQISSDGRVRSLDHEIKKRIGNVLVKAFHKSKILEQTVNEEGNLIVLLDREGDKSIKDVYLLVGETFVDNPEKLSQLIHKDGNKTNNKAENLQWTSESPEVQWKKVKGFDSYEVSNEGCVRSLDRFTEQHVRGGKTVKSLHKGRLLKPAEGASKHLFVSLSKNGKRQTKAVRMLVAESFLSNPEGLPEVRHKDGDRRNNNVNNLEWCKKINTF